MSNDVVSELQGYFSRTRRIGKRHKAARRGNERHQPSSRACCALLDKMRRRALSCCRDRTPAFPSQIHRPVTTTPAKPTSVNPSEQVLTTSHHFTPSDFECLSASGKVQCVLITMGKLNPAECQQCRPSKQLSKQASSINDGVCKANAETQNKNNGVDP